MSDTPTPAVALILILIGAVMGFGLALGASKLAHDEYLNPPDAEVRYVPQLVPIPVPSPPKECPAFI